MSKIITNILKRNGTGQEQRFIDALNPDNFELHDFTIEDWILFAYNFSENLNYFSTDNHEVPTGNWKEFFKKLVDTGVSIDASNSRGTRNYDKLKEHISKELSELTKTSELTPHLTLFVCFLKLLEFSKERFNKLTKRHLDFYYKEILQVSKKAPIPDQAHVIFELAKKISVQQIEKDTLLDAKKDSLGNPRTYATNEELIVNKASVGAIKTVYNSNTEDLKKIKVSNVANTKDGIKEPLPEEAPYWYPFGYPKSNENADELQDAQLGFAIASPMLLLKEGHRTVTLTIKFGTPFSNESFNVENILDNIKLLGSGKEKWITPTLTKVNNKSTGNLVLANTLSFTFELDYEADSLLPYNEEFLLEKYNTIHPLVQFVFDVSNEEGYGFYRNIASNTVSEITIKATVKGIQSVTIENDNGQLRANKPFHPFTTQPIKGSNFKVTYQEAFSKKWTEFIVRLNWKNVPENLKTWYGAYVNSSSYTSILEYGKEIKNTKSLDSRSLIVKGEENGSTAEEYFKAEKRMLHSGGITKETAGEILELFVRNEDEETGEISYSVNIVTDNISNSYEIDKTEGLQLSLEQDFLHEIYPKLYALALSTESKDIDLPNKPYTPLIDSVLVDYVAEEKLEVLEASIEENRIQLFHKHPFGQHEENYAIKQYQQNEQGIKDIFDKDIIQTFLVPKYCLGGHLFIGLENVEVQQSVSLLIQVLEGSENPEALSFEENEKVSWAILCDNKWKNLESSTISNNTDNFLKSGIVQFSIPREATINNTLLPEGYVWIKAQMNKSFDAVCKAINIHAQAVLATFKNNANEVSHLKEGLPSGTIKKMVTRIPQIKSVNQPYNAFGGSSEESDANFYRRISERLRHKNRAITLWDYEHLILQEFPEIYKVKCLNHTSKTSFTSAGSVSLIVVPDTVNKNVFDIYKPRVSKATLNSIKKYINALNTLHVNAEVINPNYEEVKIGLEVKFYEGLDESFYRKELKKDITKFLSPWAFDDTKEVTFDVMLHKSVLIDYLEKLPYVDYLQNVTMNGNATEYKIVPSDPKSILVSAPDHEVATVLTTCKGTKQETKLECQL